MANVGSGGKDGTDPIKSATIVILTLLFVGFYLYAIYKVWSGDSDPNNKAITLLQPIVYVIIGYYFGRMPSEKIEKQLKEEAKEKDQKADDANAQAATAKAKLSSVRTMLAGVAGDTTTSQAAGFSANLSGAKRDSEETMRITIAHAVSVINAPE